MTSIRTRLFKPWIVMPVVAVLALGGWFAFIRHDGTAADAGSTAPRTVTATKGTLAKTVSADGTVAAADTDELSFTSSGTVTAVNVAAGDTVKKGQVLATLDSAELESALAEAESNVAEAEATLSDDTDADASDAQLDADQSALDTANDALTNAKDALEGTDLVASFDGTVASVGIAKGDRLGSGGTGGTDQTGSQSGSGNSSGNLGGDGNLPNGSSGDSGSSAQIEVISAGRFTVDLGLDGSEISNVKVGQVASISVSTSSGNDRFPGGNFFPGGFQRFGNGGPSTNASGQDGGTTTTTAPQVSNADAGTKGLVTAVGKVADASSGVASYPVTVAFQDASGDFNVGATVTVAITYDQVDDAVQIPTMAVTTAADGSSTVTVLVDDKQETRTVTTGLTSGAMVQIVDGLQEGDVVVLPSFGGPGGGGTGNDGSGGGPAFTPGGAGGGPQVVQIGPGGGS